MAAKERKEHKEESRESRAESREPIFLCSLRSFAAISLFFLAVAALAADTNAVSQAELVFRSGDYEKAMTLFQQQLAIASDAESAARDLFHIGQCLTATRRYREAVAAFDNLLTKYPATSWADDALLRKGAVQAGFLKNRQAGIDTWQELIRKYPLGDRVAEAYYYKGAVEWLNGQRTSARESFRTLVRSFPDNPLSSQAKEYLQP